MLWAAAPWVARRSQATNSTELRQDGYFYTTLDQLFKIEIHASLIGKKYFFASAI